MYLIINLYYRLFYFFFYGDEARFILPPSAWAYHGGAFRDEIIAGEFAFTRNTGLGNSFFIVKIIEYSFTVMRIIFILLLVFGLIMVVLGIMV